MQMHEMAANRKMIYTHQTSNEHETYIHTYEQRTLTSYLSHSSDNSNFCILLTPTTAGKKKNLHLNIAIMPPTFCLCSFGPLCRRQYANAGFLCVATISATTADLWPPFHREICKSIIALNLIST